ncbi:MAG: DUF3800 domain-containing protein [Candidatus Cryosericum sp.]
MNWVYVDESGDDGFAAYPNCSRYFILTSLSLDENCWKDVFGQLHALRVQLKQRYGLPSKTEIHAGPMIRGNEPYRTLMGLAAQPALAGAFLMDYLTAVAQLRLSIVNVAVDKAAIVAKWPAKPRSDFDVLDIAFRYSLQRLEISMRATSSNFAVVVDQGRLGAMRNVARKATRFNYVNSSIGNVPTQHLLEDPLEKESTQSHYLQVCDAVTMAVKLYLDEKNGGVTARSPRMNAGLGKIKGSDYMQALKSVLNLQAHRADPYGVVCYP